jgi:RNA polymerase sigma-70 factor (family 1)
MIAAISELQKKIALYEDMKAYQELFDLLYNRLHRFSCSIVKCDETAEEIVSDVFIKLWQIRHRLAEIENLKVYLYTIAKNFSLSYLARNHKNPSLSLNSVDADTIIEVRSPEDICISAELLGKIRFAIQQLPPQCRLIFQLVKEDGLKYKEAATVLGVSVYTVRNQVAIATKKIGELLPVYTRLSFQQTG